MSESQEVIHEAKAGRFTLAAGSAIALLEYRRQGRQIDFYHTFVPPEARGGGHARRLVAAGLRWARAEGLDIRASCSYVADYLAAERAAGKAQEG